MFGNAITDAGAAAGDEGDFILEEGGGVHHSCRLQVSGCKERNLSAVEVTV
jgi:hypothetical protein